MDRNEISDEICSRAGIHDSVLVRFSFPTLHFESELVHTKNSKVTLWTFRMEFYFRLPGTSFQKEVVSRFCLKLATRNKGLQSTARKPDISVAESPVTKFSRIHGCWVGLLSLILENKTTSVSWRHILYSLWKTFYGCFSIRQVASWWI